MLGGPRWLDWVRRQFTATRSGSPRMQLAGSADLGGTPPMVNSQPLHRTRGLILTLARDLGGSIHLRFVNGSGSLFPWLQVSQLAATMKSTQNR